VELEPSSVAVEVIYALPDEQVLLKAEVPPGSTVRQAIQASGVLERYPHLDLEHAPIGIFSRPCKLDDPVRSGDRVEIYRPLALDPKEARRRRARSPR
jgi:putative ubiquitin-RnfH superfamily antitoxin RatB of RatAB toxin-antitoxin module